MDELALKKAGLSGNESKVYLALLELGSVGAGALIKKTELHRSAVYDTLERLMDKGLVSYVVKANRKYFEAGSPQVLMEVFERREEALRKEKQDVQKILPELDALRMLPGDKQEVTLFKGNKGIKSVLEHIYNAKQVYVLGGFSEEKEGMEYSLKYILPKFHQKRIGKKIKMSFLFPRTSKVRAEQLKKMQLTKVGVLDANLESLTGIQIYDEYVSLILWSKNPIAILIKSKEIMESYKNYFDYLWGQAKLL